MSAVYDYLMNCSVFYLATTEGNQPRVRPFRALCEFEGKLYFVTSNTKNVYKQLLANPKIGLSALRDKNSWIRLTAEVKFDDRREARVAMLEAMPMLKNTYTPDDGVMTVFYLTNIKAIEYSFTAEPKRLA